MFTRLQLVFLVKVKCNTIMTPLALTENMNSVYKWPSYAKSRGWLWLLHLLMSYYSGHLTKLITLSIDHLWYIITDM